MTLKYREDESLTFLKYCDEGNLRILVEYLTKDKDGKVNVSEQLLNDPLYTKYKNDPEQCRKSWKSIAAEFQLYGGDTIVNMFRGNGVLYKEILCDVCDKLSVNYNKKSDVAEIENNLFQKLAEDSWEKMSGKEREELLSQAGINNSAKGAAGLAALQAGIRLGGFSAYQFALIVANGVSKQLLGHGLSMAANAGLMRGVAAFSGPVGLLITALLTISAISGAAYSVTIPAVIHIAYMRQKMLEKDYI